MCLVGNYRDIGGALGAPVALYKAALGVEHWGKNNVVWGKLTDLNLYRIRALK